MLLIGFVIHGNINENLMLEYQKYNTALRIEEDADLFSYGMRTNVGNTFAYGELKAVDTVTYPEIGGSYSRVEKVKEKYTMHTRTYTTTDSNGRTTTHTQTYWTWDVVGREEIHCKKISFLDKEFDYGVINFPPTTYIDTQKVSSHIRYKYYASAESYIGTLYAVLSDDTIDDTSFYNNKTIDETIEHLETYWQLTVFWIFWILLTGGCVFGFYYIDNKWLEDK